MKNHNILTRELIKEEWFNKGITRKEFARRINYHDNSISNFCKRENILVPKEAWDKNQGRNNYSLRNHIGCCEYFDRTNKVWIVEVYSSNLKLKDEACSILGGKGISFGVRKTKSKYAWSLRISSFRFKEMKDILETYGLFSETRRINKKYKFFGIRRDNS